MSTTRKATKRTRRKKAPEGAKKTDTGGAVLVVRSRDLVKSPPGLLGFSHLLVPDEAFGKSEFKANIHFVPAAQDALFNRINEAYWDLVPELLDMAVEKKAAGPKATDEAHRAKVKILTKPELIESLREKLKQPREGDTIDLPHFIFHCNSHFTDKEGNQQPITVKAFDAHGAPLDLKAARLGRESVVMAMFTIGVWASASPFSKWVALPTLRFQGLQVLKLKQFGGGQSPAAGEVTKADLAFLEESFQADDLSALFVKPTNGGKKNAVTVEDTMDDEIPF